MVLGKTLTVAKTLTFSESGRTLFLNSDTEFAVTLPVPKMGIEYTFVVAAAPASASYTIATGSSSQLFYGQIVSSEDAGGSADSSTVGGASLITFADGVAVVGDRLHMISDGTNWYVDGTCHSYNALTVAISPSLSPSISPSLSPSISPSVSPT